MSDTELDREDSWDFKNAEKRAGVKKPRAVVSVAFRRQDFERVAEHAERIGMKLSEFIRTATLGEVDSRPTIAPLIISAGLGSIVYSRHLAPTTLATSKVVESAVVLEPEGLVEAISS